MVTLFSVNLHRKCNSRTRSRNRASH